MDFSKIYEGWRNNLFPPSAIKTLIQQTSRQRLNICKNCPHHSKFHKTMRPDAHCTHCGCTLAAKTKCLSCSCPIGKWKEVLTEEQEDEMLKDGK
jgi:hypothetical protein